MLFRSLPCFDVDGNMDGGFLYILYSAVGKTCRWVEAAAIRTESVPGETEKKIVQENESNLYENILK